MNPHWIKGRSPKTLDDSIIEKIKQLFLQDTGEVYFEGSIRNLPIQEWGGNLLLTDRNNPNDIKGLLWATKFSKERARIVAFAIDKKLQGQGFGSEGWNMLIQACVEDGHSEVQLEVRADNQLAINFYRNRGLVVISELEGYYQSGLGLVMRGPV